MDLTLRFRAYPDDDTASEAWRHIDLHRQIRNHAVRDYYRSPRNDRPSEFDQINKLPAWKRHVAGLCGCVSSRCSTDGLSDTQGSDSAQQTSREWVQNGTVEVAGKRRVPISGIPVRRLRRGPKHGPEWLGNAHALEDRHHPDSHPSPESKILVSSQNRRFWPPREIPNTDAITRVILKQERTGEWFACLVIERADEDLPEKPPLDEIDRTDCIGIDLGILSYIHTSNDLSVDRLPLETEYDRYARAQRSLDRKEHGSANWEQQRQKVAQTKRRIKRKVLDYQHKLATWLVKKYDVVAVEDLDVKPMLETAQSAKNKQDAAWSRFIDLLQYKADLYGSHVVPVDPAGTTKECSECGVETHKPIWIREHSCPACGHTEDRDLNAAKNVLAKGLEQLFSVGQGLAESMPVETVLPTFTSVTVNAQHVVEAGSPTP